MEQINWNENNAKLLKANKKKKKERKKKRKRKKNA